jgi:hypothetical protein
MFRVIELSVPDGITSHTLILVLSLSKDRLRLPMPWFDKLTTGVGARVKLNLKNDSARQEQRHCYKPGRCSRGVPRTSQVRSCVRRRLS